MYNYQTRPLGRVPSSAGEKKGSDSSGFPSTLRILQMANWTANWTAGCISWWYLLRSRRRASRGRSKCVWTFYLFVELVYLKYVPLKGLELSYGLFQCLGQRPDVISRSRSAAEDDLGVLAPVNCWGKCVRVSVWFCYSCFALRVLPFVFCYSCFAIHVIMFWSPQRGPRRVEKLKNGNAKCVMLFGRLLTSM